MKDANSRILAGLRLLSGMLMLAVWVICVSVGFSSPAQAEPRVIVFAAASLKNALDDVARQFEQAKDVPVSLSYAGSPALARQIQQGAPAQIFISANRLWMDTLETQGFVSPGGRVDLATNRLVLIAGADTDAALEIRPGMDLVGALRGDRLAMALAEAVPAGIYGRKALTSLGVWDSVKAQTAQTDNARSALRLVALGEAPLGIVYATDAAAEPRVRVVGVFPKDLHPPIIYPAARLKHGETDASKAFFRFLSGPKARSIFLSHGFGAAPGDDGS